MNTLITTMCIVYFISYGIMAYGDIKQKKLLSRIGGWGILISVTLLVLIALIKLT